MSSDNVMISASDVTKTYRLYDSHLHRIRQVLNLFGGKYSREFTALKNINFEIRRGEAVGIVGHNGSGKSTLLQIICGIRKPTSGKVRVNGRISALLELGAGFHPEFTGRENVYMQGAIMGISREQMEERLGKIEAFAAIGDFIEQPVKTYSSGMFVRLAFAVAVNVAPDILVIDEALAVGDMAFQIKCLNYIQGLKEQGVTIILVSHSLYHLRRVCSRALLLDHGSVLLEGPPAEVVSYYEQHYRAAVQLAKKPDLPLGQHFEFLAVRAPDAIVDSQGIVHVETGKDLNIVIEYRIHGKIATGIQLGVIVKRADGATVFGYTSLATAGMLKGDEGTYQVVFELSGGPLLQGDYIVGLSAFDAKYKEQFAAWEPALQLHVTTPQYSGLHMIGTVILNHRFYSAAIA